MPDLDRLRPSVTPMLPRALGLLSLLVMVFALSACGDDGDGGSEGVAGGGPEAGACLDAEDQKRCLDDAKVADVLAAMADPVDLPEGGEVYSTRCSSCHGSGGTGGIGPSLVEVADRLGEEEHVDVVVRGDGQMPAFGSQLSPEEIASVVLYERSGLG